MIKWTLMRVHAKCRGKIFSSRPIYLRIEPLFPQFNDCVFCNDMRKHLACPYRYGVIAVIQELKLRKSTRDRGYNSSACLDYIQVKISNGQIVLTAV